MIKMLIKGHKSELLALFLNLQMRCNLVTVNLEILQYTKWQFYFLLYTRA